MAIVQLTPGQLMLSIVGPTGPSGGPTGATGAGVPGPTGATGTAGTPNLFLPSGIDDAARLNSFLAGMAAAGGGVTLLDGTYIISGPITMPANVTLDGQGNSIFTCGNFRAFVMSAVTAAVIRGVHFDLSGVTATSGFVGLVTGATNCSVIGCSFLDPKGEISVQGGSTGCRVSDNTITNSLGRSITLDGAAYNTITNNQIVNGGGFGIFLENGAHHNLIRENATLLNAIELIGLKYDCHDNRIIGNHAEGTGDNGISITGQFNLVVGNISRYCAFNGIGVYGSHNSVVGNVCIGNGRHSLIDPTKTYAGIMIQSAFGGNAQYNTIVGNTTDDDQATLTQNWGVQIDGTSNYVLWATATVMVAGTYCANGVNIYFTSAGGTTGASPPVHTSGTVSDGGVSWQYINTWENATREPIGCAVGPNSNDRAITGSLSDTTVNNYNAVVDQAYHRVFNEGAATGQRYDVTGVVRHYIPWVSGETATYGTSNYATNGNSYRCSNAGGTASVEPTHTSGTVTGADGIAWTVLVLNKREYNTVTITNPQVAVDAIFGVGQIDKPGTFTNIFAGAGDPNGVVSAPKGSLFLRSDGGAGSTLYVRESATLTVWQAK